MAKIIIAAPPITGELSPLLELGRGLSGRGHQITVVTGSRFRADAADAGLGFVPVAGAADFDDRLIGEDQVRAGLAPGPEMLNHDWIHSFVNPLPGQHAVLQELLARDPDQYLISNTLWLGSSSPA